jgi:hypothetical protein
MGQRPPSVSAAEFENYFNYLQPYTYTTQITTQITFACHSTMRRQVGREQTTLPSPIHQVLLGEGAPRGVVGAKYEQHAALLQRA